MSQSDYPLREVSIDLLCNGVDAKFEIPIYQRNYAWGKDEISVLVQDVYDALTSRKQTNNIGTLVTFDSCETVYEVIDGQQRLTTIHLLLKALEVKVRTPLSFRARESAEKTLRSLPEDIGTNMDKGIARGFDFARQAIQEIVPEDQRKDFTQFFLNQVHIIFYSVPKDIDLNHYFEIMNSRGEQLEKHEIVKARLLASLQNDKDKGKFNQIWECCSEMNVYIQQRLSSKADFSQVFGQELQDFRIDSFDGIPDCGSNFGTKAICDILGEEPSLQIDAARNDESIDTFQPIIDFSNFLLIVLKLSRLKKFGFKPLDFNLDDKDLLKEFDKIDFTEEVTKQFAFNLLKARFMLDNRIVHHSCEDDTPGNKPWQLKCWQKKHGEGYLVNLSDNLFVQAKMEHLLSMLEVSFTPRQRKNYLFYCLIFLFENRWDVQSYCVFLERLVEKYFWDVYLERDQLNNTNTPLPGSFDGALLKNGALDVEVSYTDCNFEETFMYVYGDGVSRPSKGIPLFVFNYLDYLLWEKYAAELRGKDLKDTSGPRKAFFDSLGCSDFGLNPFDDFYFSRTRRSLEHYFPQASASGKDGNPNGIQINCLGNYAMIGREINSSGSNWDPTTKRQHYLDDRSGKVKHVSVASLKFVIMMQICKDKNSWGVEQIQFHQKKMLEILKNRHFIGTLEG